MEKIPKNVHYLVYYVPKKCNMAEFGARAQGILGFKPEVGYGYYEFQMKEYLKLHKNVVLMHKVTSQKSCVPVYEYSSIEHSHSTSLP